MNIENQRSLFTAIVCYGDLDEVKALIDEKRCDPNTILDQNLYTPSAHKGDTPLISACKNRLYDIAEFLISRGADVNLKSEDTYRPPLVAAAANACLPLIKLLLNNGADLNICGKYGQNALMMALESRCIDDDAEYDRLYDNMIKTAKFLVEKGININHLDLFKRTAFEYALHDDQISITLMKYLIDNGANLNILNDRGKLVYEEVYDTAISENYSLAIEFIDSLRQQHLLDLSIECSPERRNTLSSW